MESKARIHLQVSWFSVVSIDVSQNWNFVARSVQNKHRIYSLATVIIGARAPSWAISVTRAVYKIFLVQTGTLSDTPRIMVTVK